MTLVYRALLDAAREAGPPGVIDAADVDAGREALTAHSTGGGLTQDLFDSGHDLAGSMHALR